MKFQKSVIAFAVATAMTGAVGTVYAGTASSTFNAYAIEALPSLTAVTPPANAYQTGILIANGTTFTLFLQLDGGAKWATAYAAVDISLPGATTGTPAISTTDPTVMIVPFTATADIPSNTVISFGAVNSAQFNLSGVSAAGSVSESYAIVNGTAAASAGFPSSDILDQATGTIATVAEALSGTIVASNNYPIAKSSFVPAPLADFGVSETAQIDVAAATPFTKFTTPGAGASNANSQTIINLGTFFINEVSGSQLDQTGADYTLAGDTNNVTATMTGSFAAGSTFKVVSADNTCAGPAVGTSTLNAALDTVTINLGVAAAPGTPYSICMTVGGTKVIPETTPQLTAFKVVDLVAANTSYTVPSTDLYPLKQNGAARVLNNFVPAAAAPYQTYVRIANNGKLAGDVQVAVIGADGTTLGSGSVGTFAVGQSKTFSAAEIETAAGVTLAASDRVQVKVTAPTVNSSIGGLDVQAFLADPNGGFTNMTSNK